jgi:apolipoprotein N-acyltransferase
MSETKRIGLVLLSAVLLILAFPRMDLWPLAFVGFIPLFLILENNKLKSSFALSFLCGFIFFVGVLYWLMFVTKIGVFLLAAYCGLYFGLFGLAYFYFSKINFGFRWFLLPSVWVLLEYLRGILFSGFDWGSLGYSQYRNLPILQIADVTGKYGVGFLVLWTNLFIYEAVFKKNRKIIPVWLGIIGLVLSYGYFQMSSQHLGWDKNKSLKISLVQGNIPQEIKWVESFYPSVIDAHSRLTLKALQDKPDLIIWPETSFPGIWEGSNDYVEQMKSFVGELKTPLLFGSVVGTEQKLYYNSAVLVDPTGQSSFYNKIRLVPFGEFIPFRKQLAFLSEVIPIADFDVGKDFTLFPFRDGQFSVLICFEDSFASLTRQFVKRGSQLLVNITNDAWFHDTKEAEMHLQASVFRAIENRRFFVRCGNTGISGFITPLGQLREHVEEHGKKSFINGVVTGDVYFQDQITFYTKFGDIFVLGCGFIVAIALLLTKKDSLFTKKI